MFGAQNIKLIQTFLKLAACGNIIPGMTSVYEWKGNVETETEGKPYQNLMTCLYNTPHYM